MKILFIAPRFHSNQYSLVKKLLEENHQVAFFAMNVGNSEDYSLIKPELIKLSKLNGLFSPKGREGIDIAKFANRAIPDISAFYKMVLQFNPDVTIVRGGSTPVYSWLLLPLQFISRMRIVYYTQGPQYVKELPLLRKLHDFIVTKILKVPWYTPVMYKGHKEESVTKLEYMQYIPFFMYLNKTSSIKVEQGTKLRVLAVAKFETRKNLMVLVEAVYELNKLYGGISLTIIGSTGTAARESYYESLISWVDKMGIKEIVDVKKDIPFSEMERNYKSHHVFVLPSIKEPASVSQLEAMSYGLPVICSRDNGTAHYVSDSINGYIVESTMISLRDAIAKYLLKPGRVEDHSKASIDKMKNEFSIDKSYKKLMSLII